MAVVVRPYDPTWPEQAQDRIDALWPVVRHCALGIEHVGSTSVPGLAAKPVLDLDIVIADRDALDAATTALEGVGYEARGDLGIRGRYAFRAPPELVRHNLYVCLRDSLGLKNHLRVRDHLRSHPEDAAAYGALKLQLAQTLDSIDRYTEAKTAFLLRILSRYDLDADELSEVIESNRA